MINISEIEMLYTENVWAELSRCWIKYEKPVSPDGELWFGPLAAWLNEFKEAYAKIGVMPYANSIRKIVCNRSRLSQELGYLIPNVKARDSSCNIRNFLPVIIWAYGMNWSTPREDTEYSSLFMSVAHGSMRKAPSEHKFDKHKGRFRVKNWQDDFAALKVRNVVPDTPWRFLSIYYRSLLFFFLLQKTSDVCNVTMSFLVFAKMTRLVELFGAEAVRLINSILSSEEPIRDDSFHDKILSFVERTMNDPDSTCLFDCFLPESQIEHSQEFWGYNCVEVKDISSFTLFALHLQEELFDRQLSPGIAYELSDTVMDDFDSGSELTDEKDKVAWDKFEIERRIEDITFAKQSQPRDSSIYDDIFIEFDT